jgi:hypothetical protein
MSEMTDLQAWIILIPVAFFSFIMYKLFTQKGRFW